MNVDLPAPLSPSTQVTWPALTTVEMSFSAMTLPKYFDDAADLEQRRSSTGPPSARRRT